MEQLVSMFGPDVDTDHGDYNDSENGIDELSHLPPEVNICFFLNFFFFCSIYSKVLVTTSIFTLYLEWGGGYM